VKTLTQSTLTVSMSAVSLLDLSECCSDAPKLALQLEQLMAQVQR
jgi:hypothetical protein